MHEESACINPTIYIYKNKCKKALLNCQGIDELQSKCGFVDEDINHYCKQNNNNKTWFYANY